jgi:CO/xanthine dehydrogenase FAD-binding subunit
MQPFELASPDTLQRAVDILVRDPAGGVILAGGCDLLPRLKDGLVNAKRLLDLRNVRGLTGTKAEADGTLRVGAMTLLEDFAADAAVGFDYSALAAAAGRIGSPQVRGVATVGGNLCQFAVSTLGPILVAIEAQLAILGPAGERKSLAADFYRPPQASGEGPRDLRATEILTHLLLPKPTGLRIGVYEVRPRSPLEWPTATAAVAVQIEGNQVAKARIVLGAVGPAPVQVPQAAELIQGKNPDRALVHKAAEAAAALVDLAGGRARQVAARAAVERALATALGL